jgi:polyisoprenoid-binding protein YceI
VSDRVFVFTFKEGLLSRVAHDLRLRVEPRGLSIAREQDRVRAELAVDALAVDGAIRKGELDIDALSRRDRTTIVETIQTEILDARRQPQIRFEGQVREDGEDLLRVEGELELAGVRRPLSFTLEREAGRLRARISLRPSDFGIAPYKALAGAIRLQDRVIVELNLDGR